MTPTAKALHRLSEAIPADGAFNVPAMAILTMRNDQTLAQDIADGQALRELDAAHGGTWSLHVVKQMSGTVGFAIEAWHRQTKVFGKPDDEMPDFYPTIAAAADACRAAIEATR